MARSAPQRHDVHCVWSANAVLGEAPVWVAVDAAVYWVDIGRGQILRYRVPDARTGIWAMPTPMTALAPMRDGRLLCTSRQAIHAFDPQSGHLASLAQLDFQARDVRINDGCAHPDGAFWFGTMDLGESEPVGDFYRWFDEDRCERIPAAFGITNGPAFSPDGDAAYFVDTLNRRILCAPIKDGVLAAALRLFARIPEEDGFPDGLAVDAEGGIWCAHWGGARVTRFDAAGHVSDVIRLPVSNATKCAFGGARLDRLFVTTARKGLDAAALAAEPLAGGLFEIATGYRGLPPNPCRHTAARETMSDVCVFKPT